MPPSNELPELTPRASAREQLLEFRRIVSAAIGELRSAEIRNTYSALSIEELMDQHVERMEVGSPTNPSRLARIRRIKADLDANIEAMRATPPELFRRQDAEGDVNTPPSRADGFE